MAWINGDRPLLAGARPTYRRLVVALDTGGAIKGEVRADLYLGQGRRPAPKPGGYATRCAYTGWFHGHEAPSEARGATDVVDGGQPRSIPLPARTRRYRPNRKPWTRQPASRRFARSRSLKVVRDGVKVIEPRRKHRIARERDPIGARLDLHGLDQERARRALEAFLRRAWDEGVRAVLVITGKGVMGDGVLRRKVPEWLATPYLASIVAENFGSPWPPRREGGALCGPKAKDALLTTLPL